jgi:hypothetical protein
MPSTSRTSGQPLSKRLANIPFAPVVPTQTRATASRKSMPFKVVDDPNVFLAALNNKPASTKNEAQVKPDVPKENVPTPKDTLMTDASPPHAPKVNLPAQEEGDICQVPVTKFSFPAQAALAPGEISTHTNGAPSPVAQSAFSSTQGRDSSHTTAASHVHDLIGLGITSVDLPRDTTMLEVDDSSFAVQADPVSPNPSLIDSPIIDDVDNVTLPANKGGVIQFDGPSRRLVEAASSDSGAYRRRDIWAES